MRQFPISAPPLAEESLDSWIHWVARQLISSPRAVAVHLELQPTASAGFLNRDLSGPDVDRLATQIGHPARHIHDATLARWDHLGLKPSRHKRGLPPGVWQRGSGARYCHACLTESRGRWKLWWYLPWAVICPNHLTTLRSNCSRCGTAARTTRLRAADLTDRDWDALNCRCGARLGDVNAFGGEADGSADELPWPRNHPTVSAQARILRILHPPGHPPQADEVDARAVASAMVAGEPVSPLEWFHDLSELTRRAAYHFVLAGGVDSATTPMWRGLDPATPHGRRVAKDVEAIRSRTGPGDTAAGYSDAIAAVSARTPVLAAAITAAVFVLDSPTRQDLSQRLDWVPKKWRLALQQRAANHGVGLSQPLLDELTIPVRQTRTAWLRHLQKYEVPPRDDPEQTAPLAGFCAANLHPALAAHLGLTDKDLQGAAILAGLLALSRGIGVEQAAQDIGLAHIGTEIGREWEYLGSPRARDWIRLTARHVFSPEYLAAPVHFGQRRDLLAEPQPLPARVCQALASELRLPDQSALRLAAALYCWERLTGTSALLSRRGVSLHGPHRRGYERCRRSWHRCLPAALHSHLNDWLSENEPAQNGTPKAGLDLRDWAASMRWQTTTATQRHLSNEQCEECS